MATNAAAIALRQAVDCTVTTMILAGMNSRAAYDAAAARYGITPDQAAEMYAAETEALFSGAESCATH
jgi:hypothetical protein